MPSMDEDGNNPNIIAPFVMKTYHMVNDPSTDHLISWGQANNSFIVVESLEFSQRILPSYFKHNNFSSFVRQLNTYGFRKVDPDRWEFANEWFLRGQKHLLPNISRRKHVPRGAHSSYEGDDQDLISEIERLREEQKSLDEEIKVMNRRLEATEHRPHQMMAFLSKVVEDPDILRRVMMERAHVARITRHLGDVIPDKRRRLLMMSSSSSSSGVVAQSNNSEEDEGTTVGAISSFHNFNNFEHYASSPETCDHSPTGLAGPNSEPNGTFWLGGEKYDWAGPSSGYSPTSVGPTRDSVHLEHVPSNIPPTYPFSLLDGGF